MEFKLIEIYEDGASNEEIIGATQKFFDTYGYFEASSWVVSRTEDGKLAAYCCQKHPVKIYNSVAEWSNGSVVYPDKEQWVKS